MTNGLKTMILNSQERILSVDANRLQSFAGAGLLNILRQWLLASAGVSTGAPLKGLVLDGLYVKPGNGTFQLQVAAGTALVIETPGADEDALHYASMSTDYNNPALFITANGSGFPRIDLIECQRLSQVVETDNRDIFNVSTGLFTAASVDKAVASTFSFRVRAGTPAGGLPAPDTGWMPLAAVLVPNGAASNDACTFWDLRPLVNDLALDISSEKPVHLQSAFGAAGDVNVDGVRSVQGDVRWVHAGRNIGGTIQSTSPGTFKQYVTIADASPGFAPAASQLVFGYLCFPGGYPRWSRYTDSGARVPSGFRGLFTFSTVTCDLQYRPIATVDLPSSLGLTAPAATTEAVAIFCVPWDGTGPVAFESVGGEITFANPEGSGTVAVSNAALGINTTLTLNTHYPAPVKGLGVNIYKKWDTSDALFLPFNKARMKRHNMDLNYGFGASFAPLSVGWLRFGEKCISLSYNPSGFSDRSAEVSRLGRIPMVTYPDNVAPIPSIVVFVPTDSTDYIPMESGSVVSYGATPVSPLTRITISGWTWAG